MSYEVIGDTEALGQFASNAGLSDLVEAAVGKPALERLFETGESRDVPAVITELRTITGTAYSTAQALADLIKDEESIIITDGMTGTEGFKKQDSDIEFEGKIVKLDKAQQLAFGWFSVVEINGRKVEDTQGDIISPETLEQSAYEFVLEARKGGEMHRAEKGEVRGVARLVESVVFTADKQKAMSSSLQEQGIDAQLDLKCVAWWGGMKILDPNTWERVTTGALRAWSIGGKGKREDSKG